MRVYCVAIALLLLAGCQTPEMTARDAIAGASGFLTSQQNQHLVECRATPTKPLCVDINRGIAAQHALADSLVIYCSGAPLPGVIAYKDGGNCVPVAAYKDALAAAVSSLNAIITDIKNIIGSTAKSAWERDLDQMDAYLGRG